MSYTALYRKIRPRTFADMVGQPHVKRALTNQLKAGAVCHAYLFCGTRGTGKTSAARILARAVNCLAPAEGEPCNTCEICESILAERNLDVAEIDAASNNGVDNIRDLRDEVKFLPNQARYKVYIVDEVHMLSGAAFNALLKTLEEPPAHVIFILATTDPQKIPATILSRCQRYDFRRISTEEITGALRGYLQSENLPFEEGALNYIAYHSDGAMRDALSLLDQSLTMGVTAENVREILGAVSKERLIEFTAALAACDTAALMQIIDDAMNEGRDVGQFAADLTRHFRDELVAGLTGGGQAGVPATLLMKYITAFSEALREMRFAPHMRTAFEVCALKLCMPREAPAPPIPAKPAAPPKPVPAKPAPVNTSLSGFIKTLPIPTQKQINAMEEINGIYKIFCENEATAKIIEGKKATLEKSLAEFLALKSPPNLAIEVREAYNKPKNEAPPPPPKPAPAPEPTDDWASFGQEMLGGEELHW